MKNVVVYADDDLIIEVSEDLEEKDKEGVYSVWFMDKGIHLMFVQEEWDAFCDAMQLVIGEE